MSQLYFPSLSANARTGDGPASLAELQGALCGLLCMNAHADRSSWHQKLFENFHPSQEEKLDLVHLFDETIHSLNSLNFDLQLELPDDNTSLASRLSAMADWCQGLIYGLCNSGMSDETELSNDCQEYVTDLVRVSQVNFDDVEESEQEEKNFAELLEYLRMGLFLLYGELQPIDPTKENTEH